MQRLRSALAREPSCHKLTVPEQFSIILFSLFEPHDVLLGNDQYMSGRLRIDVLKDESALVFINFFGWNFAGNDLAEKAIGHVDNDSSKDA